jgi:hypothetical protein
MNKLILSVLLVLTIASSVVNGFAVGGMNGGEFFFSQALDTVIPESGSVVADPSLFGILSPFLRLKLTPFNIE